METVYKPDVIYDTQITRLIWMLQLKGLHGMRWYWGYYLLNRWLWLPCIRQVALPVFQIFFVSLGSLNRFLNYLHSGPRWFWIFCFSDTTYIILLIENYQVLIRDMSCPGFIHFLIVNSTAWSRSWTLYSLDFILIVIWKSERVTRPCATVSIYKLFNRIRRRCRKITLSL